MSRYLINNFLCNIRKKILYHSRK